MKYNTSTLPCGVRVIQVPSTSDVVYCGYVIAAGARHESKDEEGLAHFCEHVTFKGTQKRKASNILNELESVGGDLNAFTNKEDTTYYASVRKEHVQRAVALLTDIVFHSTYPQKEINKEVAVICDEIESYNDSPSELIFDEFENILFHNHPLGHNILGSAERVRSYQTADALRFTRSHYLPQKSVFFLHGDIPFQRLMKMLKRATADLPSAAADPLTDEIDTLGPQPGAGAEPIVVNRDTHQSHVVIGGRSYAADDEHRLPLYVINNILGGPGMNSRLNVSLRERHGLVYTVESCMASYGDTGVWCTYFGCDSSAMSSTELSTRRSRPDSYRPPNVRFWDSWPSPTTTTRPLPWTPVAHFSTTDWSATSSASVSVLMPSLPRMSFRPPAPYSARTTSPRWSTNRLDVYG